MKVSKGWHYAFVFDEEFSTFDVHEIYKTTLGGYLRTSKPVLHLPGNDVDDAIRGLEHLINDLKKDQRVFKSIERLDKYYEIGEECED